MASVSAKIASIWAGRASMPRTMAVYVSRSTVPSTSPKYSPSRCSTTIWVVYALVVATAISGPAQVYSTSSDSRAMEEPTTLTMDRMRAPRFLASRRAAMVSSVSPDWLMTMTRSPWDTSGSL